ncbi:MBL fold metallo-hydrolase [Nonlabens ponticola]|uniref:MBL fold metallo-hydrolase n=1 Tax=Nonlabens ponticola TaxID=2496866 RepID=A0A3S9MXX4_9FLAO|nr:MBL fold metallo-hydrolase [Nonlabens ponticola]AZQ43988.1 MBL fold metallo-hydrolase [Nonlabens ponticola]
MKHSLQIIACSLLFATSTIAQINPDQVEIKTTQLTDNFYMLEGRGGNILIAVASDEVMMIDSQFAPLSDKLKTAIAAITDKPLTYLVNTHHHGDHTGGNENFNNENLNIVAQANVLKRLQEANKPDGYLPEITLVEEMRIDLPDENAMIIHVHNAHTDGDSFVYFPKSNVVHMGDVFFNGRYPYIDLKSGGSVNGYIEAQQRVLATINPDTQIVPGHGNLGTYKDLVAHVNMLMDIRSQVKLAIAQEKSRERILADEKITKRYDAQGYGNGFINPERLRGTFYDSLISLEEVDQESKN